MRGKRMLGLITAMCFIATCFFTNSSFASSDKAPARDLPPDEKITSVTGPAEPEDPSTGEDADSDGPEADPESSAVTGAAVDLPSSPDKDTKPEEDSTSTPGAIDATEEKDDESLWYIDKIPMKKEHQKLLWDYCKKRKLDYIDMLALISLESNFTEKCSSGKYKGYFQISSSHGPNLSKTLKTLNKPLDGAININWGTAMYSWILADKRVKDLEGKKQRDVALSIYQRGTGGYDKLGLSKSFLAKYYKKRDIIVSYFEK